MAVNYNFHFLVNYPLHFAHPNSKETQMTVYLFIFCYDQIEASPAYRRVNLNRKNRLWLGNSHQSEQSCIF